MGEPTGTVPDQENGRPFTTNQLWKVFNKAREDHPEVEGAIWHGLRANAVIRLRQSRYSVLQISNMVGMSPEMVDATAAMQTGKRRAKPCCSKSSRDVPRTPL